MLRHALLPIGSAIDLASAPPLRFGVCMCRMNNALCGAATTEIPLLFNHFHCFVSEAQPANNQVAESVLSTRSWLHADVSLLETLETDIVSSPRSEPTCSRNSHGSPSCRVWSTET